MQLKIPIVLAIDADDTIFYTEWPNIKGLRPGAKKYINQLHNEGYYIIVWTCRSEGKMVDGIRYLIDNDVKFHQCNEHHPALIKAFGNDTRKISADIYIDDKAPWLFGIPSWFVIYWLIKWRSLFITKYILSFCKPEHYEQ